MPNSWESPSDFFPVQSEVVTPEAPKTLPKLAFQEAHTFQDALDDWKQRNAAYCGANGEEL